MECLPAQHGPYGKLCRQLPSDRPTLTSTQSYMTTTFNVTMNKTVKVMTAVCFAIIFTVFGITYGISMYDGIGLAATTATTVTFVAVLVSMFLSYYYSPKKIVADSHSLTIIRRIGKKALPIRDIISIERYGGMATDLRLFGVGGVFGFTGWFTGGKGKYFAYVGDHRNTVMLTTTRRKYVVSCDKPEELVALVSSLIGNGGKA